MDLETNEHKKNPTTSKFGKLDSVQEFAPHNLPSL